jgi:single-strand DNA-binding protein
MISFNKVILIGNLTRDPEVRFTPSGTPVANFRIAVNHRYKQGGEMKDDVCYIDIVVFGKPAESCGQYLNKGDGVIVDGRLQERRWETDDGQKRSKYEIVAQQVRFLPKRQGGSAPAGPPEDAAAAAPPEEAPVEDDVPF